MRTGTVAGETEIIETLVVNAAEYRRVMFKKVACSIVTPESRRPGSLCNINTTVQDPILRKQI